MLNAEESIRLLAAAHTLLEEVCVQLVNEWAPEAPPTTLMMASFGEAIEQNMQQLSPSELGKIFANVEHILRDGNEQAQNAVATGFLESLASASDRSSTSMSHVLAQLGPLAREYLKAWDEFTGANTGKL